ncbi:MAG: SpoIIE family protein phosphatase [Myxococcota bacterium]
MAARPTLTLIMRDRSSVAEARERVRACAREAGLEPADVERMAVAVSELGQNQLDHARLGTIACTGVVRGGVTGLEIRAVDRGPGLIAPATAIASMLPPKGLGVGLAGVRRAVDELDVDVRTGESTTIVIRKFRAAVARQPEVAVLGRGVADVSGDTAAVWRDDATLWVAVVDGAGHGVEAREAADRCLHTVQQAAQAGEEDLRALLDAAHRALRRSRGAACTVARWTADRVVVCGVGNVAARVVDPAGGVRAAAPLAGMLGVRLPGHPRTHELRVAPRSALVLATDGVSARRDPVPEQVGRSAVHLAELTMARCAKDHDDALVLIAR